MSWKRTSILVVTAKKTQSQSLSTLDSFKKWSANEGLCSTPSGSFPHQAGTSSEAPVCLKAESCRTVVYGEDWGSNTTLRLQTKFVLATVRTSRSLISPKSRLLLLQNCPPSSPSWRRNSSFKHPALPWVSCFLKLYVLHINKFVCLFSCQLEYCQSVEQTQIIKPSESERKFLSPLHHQSTTS